MRGLARILIVLMIAAALPLRGYAAVAADLCGGQHGAAQSDHVDHHDHGSTQDHSGHSGEQSSTSICSHCTSCSVGASLAPDAGQRVSVLISGADRIPFIDARRSAHVPDHLDRPPLVS